MAATSDNSLVSTARASDASPTVQLHPLVLLTITDCVTRHTLRRQKGPVVGAILGAQDGQNITMEVAFQAKLRSSEDGEVALDDEWFSKRIEDCKSILSFFRLQVVEEAYNHLSQGRTQGTSTRSCRLVHSRSRLRPRTSHSSYSFTHIRSLHRVATTCSVPSRDCLLGRDRCRQAASNPLRVHLRQCIQRTER
jgi:hypothetical protein